MNDRALRVRDEWLVLRCQDGDSQAVEQLVSRWQNRLLRHACRLVGNEAAAWDVMQDAWMSVLQGLRRLDDPGAFGGWAYRIVTRKCADHLRRLRRQRRLEAQQAPPEVPEDLEKDDDVALLRAGLAKLNTEQRAILSLHYLEELGVERIAEILSIPAGTVKSRLHNARSALKELLERRNL